ncbi:Mis12-Mtw1 protein family-domain-containing protein [Panaeolus papilionaceus]|nr:Mis12-Mtw1 protein family-domain-containing protein [Panaeolus papilionaceus]
MQSTVLQYHHMDLSQPMPESETPQIERNKRLRQGVMDAIIADREEDTIGNGNGVMQTPSRGRGVERGAETPGSGRRKSSVGRGKRVSMSFASSGVIAHPHNSVNEGSFYKHIDTDLPEPERVRQLLTWCSVRAANPNGSSSSSSKASTSTIAPSAPDPPLPPLSANASKVVKSIQDNLVKMLADKQIYLNEGEIGRTRGGNGVEALAENEQNVRNRKWEVAYTEHILG